MKGKIRKIISLALMTVMLFGCFGITGCNFESQFESDGKFKYYYDESKDGYAIVGTEPDGYGDPMYIPAYYKGKVVYSTVTSRDSYMGGPTIYAMSFGDAKTVYYPFACPTMIRFVSNKELYITANSSKTSFTTLLGFNRKDIDLKTTYLTSKRFSKVLQEIKEEDDRYFFDTKQKGYDYKIFDYYLNIKTYGYDIDMAMIKIANTSYMFNYEDAPNEGYFFINNFENGALIENTPYEPLREGYVFDGWYKEPQCINKCNFGVDTYVEQYDENGELIFNELKLYAKWIKN